MVGTKHTLLTFWFILSFIGFLNAQEDAQVIWTANWSHDGTLIATGGDDGVLRIFDGTTFELLMADTTPYSIMRLRWHPSKRLLAIAASEDGSGIYDYDKHAFTRFKGPDNTGGRGIAWNASGTLVGTADYDAKVITWDLEGNPVKVARKATTKSYIAIDWHPQKDEVIALSDEIRYYDASLELKSREKHRPEEVLMLCIEWHPSGDFFVIGDYGDYLKPHPAQLQWRAADGTLIHSIERSEAEYRNMSWSPDGKQLATASDKLRIWSHDGELLHQGDSEHLLWGVDWSPDGRHIVTSDIAGHVMLWTKDATVLQELKY